MQALPSSFRDPSGFVFAEGDRIFRQINACGLDDYRLLHSSGLYQALTGKGWLVPHTEVPGDAAGSPSAARVIQPEKIEYISYPYEWCFSQLKDAALLTLDIQLLALKHGMTLKDASAYNVQFRGFSPVLIDTLSFTRYEEGKPWVAYRQFCQHFLAPLLLICKRDLRLAQLAKVHIDGIPLDLASRLLPRRTRFSPGILMHLHLHARAQQNFAASDDTGIARRKYRPLSKAGMQGIVTGLKSLIQDLDWNPTGTEWADYYSATNYTDHAFDTKRSIINTFLDKIGPKRVWDIGGNTGVFSRLASARGISTASFDIDPAAIEINYRQAKKEKNQSLLPLVIDLTNPSNGIGWANQERQTLAERGPVDCIFALALIHHLAISNNVPLAKISSYLASLGKHLIMEFVPKSDSQVKRLLSSREDIFDTYTIEGFEAAFSQNFVIRDKVPVNDSKRTMYWLEKKPSSHPH